IRLFHEGIKAELFRKCEKDCLILSWDDSEGSLLSFQTLIKKGPENEKEDHPKLFLSECVSCFHVECSEWKNVSR
ncbi:MAG: hypothetical protein J6B53_15415, partial [Clostridia bacterium]|nr:hypothetical protein [Clostridia bacterium]